MNKKDIPHKDLTLEDLVTTIQRLKDTQIDSKTTFDFDELTKRWSPAALEMFDKLIKEEFDRFVTLKEKHKNKYFKKRFFK